MGTREKSLAGGMKMAKGVASSPLFA